MVLLPVLTRYLLMRQTQTIRIHQQFTTLIGVENLGPLPARHFDGPPMSAPRARVLEVLQRTGSPLSVDEVAAELGLHPNTARKHLDALVGAGAAVSELAPTGGRGRPAHRYAADSHGVPDPRVREYVALASALAGHIARTSPDPRQDALAAGEEWGRSMTLGRRPGSAARARRQTIGVLGELGFAPEQDGRVTGRVRLTRCPLLDAAREHPDVVCAVHLGLVRGALDHLGGDPAGADLVPFAEPGACVLRLTASG